MAYQRCPLKSTTAMYTHAYPKHHKQCSSLLFTSIADNCVPGCKSYRSCTEKDWGLFSEVRYFQLGGIGIPDELNQRFLKALVLQEENETEKLKQESQVIRKETQAQVFYVQLLIAYFKLNKKVICGLLHCYSLFNYGNINRNKSAIS